MGGRLTIAEASGANGRRTAQPQAVQPQTVRALQHRLLDADNGVVGRVVELLDQAADPEANETLLAPLRHRLAGLRPPRPLRFARLLFLPLDPLIVAPGDWRPGAATIPRNAIEAMAKAIRAALGEVARPIEEQVSGHKTNASEVISAAGAVLWPRAAEALRSLPPPADWPETGLKPECFTALAQAVAAVLWRAGGLRTLAREIDVGLRQADERAFKPILAGLEHETSAGCAMLVSLVMLQIPKAAPVLRKLMVGGAGTEQVRLQKVVDQVVDGVLSNLLAPSGSIDEIGRAHLTHAVEEVRRLIVLLTGIEGSGSATLQRSRLMDVRRTLDRACQTRFATSLQDEVLTPLANLPAAMDHATQRTIETAARDLRMLEQSARTLGGGQTYDRLLAQASDVVSKASATADITLGQRVRLIELLSGPEAAEAIYREETAKTA